MRFCRPIVVASLLWAGVGAAHALDLQGHRGARGLAPENTLAAFRTALAVGVTTLELDVGVSKDGVLVVYHDRTLNPAITRGPDGAFLTGRGPQVRTLTVAELKQYDVGRLSPGTAYANGFPAQRPADGERIPTLAEVFALVASANAPHMRFNIETKLSPNAPTETVGPEEFAALLVRAIRDAGLSARVSIQSFDWRTLKAAETLAPEIERVCLSAQGAGFDTIQRNKPGASPFTAGLDVDDHEGSTPKLVAAAGCAVWSPSFRDVSPQWIAEAKALKLKVVPWTVNERVDMERLIDMGVDGLITDYPDRLREVMTAKGMPLPPQVKAP